MTNDTTIPGTAWLRVVFIAEDTDEILAVTGAPRRSRLQAKMRRRAGESDFDLAVRALHRTFRGTVWNRVIPGSVEVTRW